MPRAEILSEMYRGSRSLGPRVTAAANPTSTVRRRHSPVHATRPSLICSTPHCERLGVLVAVEGYLIHVVRAGDCLSTFCLEIGIASGCRGLSPPRRETGQSLQAIRLLPSVYSAAIAIT